MEASFANIQVFIEDRLGSNFSQDVHESNLSFTAPSPVLVDQAPSQSQTDPSVRNPRIGAVALGAKHRSRGRLSWLPPPFLRPCVLRASRCCRVLISQIE